MQRPLDPTAISRTSVTLEQRVASLESRLATLEKLLSVGADGGLTVNAPKISLQAPTVEVKGSNYVNLSVARTTISLQAASIYALGSDVSFKTDNFHAGANTRASMSGAKVVLNGSTKPLARVGDAITSSGAPSGMTGVIASNTSTVFG